MSLGVGLWVKEDGNNLLNTRLNLFNLFFGALFVFDSCAYIVAPRWEEFSIARDRGEERG